MTILADYEIAAYALDYGMIDPYIPELIRSDNGNKVISYGQSSAGYDARLDRKFKVMRVPQIHGTVAMGTYVIDPKNPASFEQLFEDVEGDYLDIPPHSFALGQTVERWSIPPELVANVLSKSTYVRVGLHGLMTPAEPGWRGHLTLELANLTPFHVRVYAGEGICQFQFHRLSDVPNVTYDNRPGGPGKYQDQGDVTTAKV